MTSLRNILRVAVAPVTVISLTGVALEMPAPAASATSVAHAVTAHAKHHATVKKVHFKGTYTGTIAMLWSANSVKATSITGTGKGTLLGKSKVSGSGTAATSSTCDPLSGTGYIAGAGSKLKLKVVSSSKTQACAAAESAPTNVTVKGVAKVTGGTGKYKGAKGTLKIEGSFQIQSNTAGSNETDTFKATLKGVVKVRK